MISEISDNYSAYSYESYGRSVDSAASSSGSESVSSSSGADVVAPTTTATIPATTTQTGKTSDEMTIADLIAQSLALKNESNLGIEVPATDAIVSSSSSSSGSSSNIVIIILVIGVAALIGYKIYESRRN